jgi:glutamate/aspartate transport system permease protein
MPNHFDFDVIVRTAPYLFYTGLAFTIKLTLLAMSGGVVLGTLLAVARISPIRFLAWCAATYVNLVRAVPLVLVIFWFYFLVPYIGAWVLGRNQPVKVGAFESSVITFIMFEAAYYCEIMRAGIRSIASGQSLAARALGMTFLQSMRHIVLPQAFRNMIPILLTQTIVLFQDVSLVYVLSITDFVGAASKVAHRDGRLLEMYVFVAVVYFIMCFSLSSLVRQLQNRIAIVR